MSAGEQACESRQHGPVRRLGSRPMDLAPQDPHFVAPHDDLDGEVGVSAEDDRTSWRTRQNAR